MDISVASQSFLETHGKLLAIAAKLAPYEREYLSLDGLGSAGMEMDGVLGIFMQMSTERGSLVTELRRLRLEFGDEKLLAELRTMEGSERAINYLIKVPLHREIPKATCQIQKRKCWWNLWGCLPW